MSYPASDPHAEPLTEIFPAGVYRSSEAAPFRAYPDPPPSEPTLEPAARSLETQDQVVELSPEALRRLRARLVRKYH
jgi:hypothetical protein